MLDIKEGEIFRFEINGAITKSCFEINNSYYSYSLYYYGRSKESNKYMDDYLESLIDYGKCVGVDEDVILELVNNGDNDLEIEEMLYELDFYGENDFCAEI